MFSFMKKDKDKETKKEKEEKKKEKKERKEKEKKEKHREQTTPEELNRLEEVKRGVFRRKSDREKKKSHTDSQISPDDDDGGFLQRDSDSSTSLSSAGKLSPGRQVTGDQADANRPVPPAIMPKPKSILKSKGERQNVSDNLDDTTVLRSNTAYNQATSGIVPGQDKVKPKPVPRNTRPNVKDKPPEFMPPPPPESPPPEKSYKIALKLPEIIPAKPPRVRELVINRTKAGDFGFTLRKGVITQKDDRGDAKHTVIFAEPGAGQSSSQTGLIPGDRLIEVNGVNVESSPREEIIDMIRKTGDTVVLKVQPIPELIELSVRPSVDGSVVDVQEEVVKGGTLKRSGSMRYKKPGPS